MVTAGNTSESRLKSNETRLRTKTFNVDVSDIVREVTSVRWKSLHHYGFLLQMLFDHNKSGKRKMKMGITSSTRGMTIILLLCLSLALSKADEADAYPFEFLA